jgi:hypothetical protein
MTEIADGLAQELPQKKTLVSLWKMWYLFQVL